MKVAVLFSGGKDSCLALHKVWNEHEIKYLLSVLPENFDSFMFHKPYFSLLEKQAEMIGKELRVMKSEGVENEEVNDLRELIKEVKNGVEGIVIGGIASSYQGKRIKGICDELGLKFIAPLWDYSPNDVWRELLDGGFRVILTKVSCDGLGKEWLGRDIGEREFEELRRLSERYKFRIDFEGGEAESAVLEMPEFEKSINIDYDVVSEGEYRHWMDVKEVK